MKSKPKKPQPSSRAASTRDVPPRATLVLTALVGAALVCNLNIAAANVALPSIGNALDAAQVALNLVGVGAGLGLSMSVMYFGALADRYGRKQLLITGLSLIIIASLLSAFAPTIEVLIGSRIFTGIAAGMAFPTTLSLISALWAQGSKRTTAIAIWSSVGGMASVAGAILAGFLLTMFWWGSVFLLSVPLALISLFLVTRFVPSHIDETTEPVDHAGGILSTLGIAAFVLGISAVFAPHKTGIGLMLITLAVVLIALFIWRQRHAVNPLFDLTVAKRRTFWGPAVAGAIVFGGLIGAMFVGEQFMQNILGYSALQSGLSVVPAAVGLILMAPLSAQLVTKSGTRTTILTGYSLVLVGFITMLFWREGITYPLIGTAFFAIGCGVSFVTTASSRALTSSTPIRRVGMASATSDLQSDLGGSIMQALLGALLAAGFAQSFAKVIASTPQADSLSADVTNALQASYASAARVAEQYPQYHDGIIEAARHSLSAGATGAYLVGTIAIIIGFAIARFVIPSKEQEIKLLADYAKENTDQKAQR